MLPRPGIVSEEGMVMGTEEGSWAKGKGWPLREGGLSPPRLLDGLEDSEV